MLHGIDMSNWNHPLDPTAVPGEFVICRASEGKGMRDEHFAEYDAKIRPSAKLAGAYHFMWIGTEGVVVNTPAQEAANFAAAVRDHLRPGFLLVADFEPRYHGRNTGWAVDFAHEVKRLTGRTPLLYANQSTLDVGDWSRWRAEIGTDYWLAGGTPQYAQRVDGYQPGVKPRNPYGWGDPILWQFTEHGYLPGWDKRLDLNIFTGDASDWRRLADRGATPESSTPQEPPVTIPPLRENDPAVDLVNSHGETLRSSNGAPRKACLCMALTFPLIEQEMIRRGLIKRTIDVYQAGYNAGKVAASAGTHDLGGVIDVAQGITLEQRRVWAEFGVMMFPRTRQYGWTTGDHGHGVIHGCPHQTASADQQVRSGIAGRDGLVSNLVRNFEAPKRTWQDAYRAATNSKPSPTTRPPLEDDMPESKRHAQTLTPNGRDWAVTDAVVLPSDGPAKASARGTVTVPADVTVTTRWVSFHGKGGDGWWRDTVVTHSPGTVETTVIVDQASPADLRLDVKTDKPCEAKVELTAQVWRK